MSHKERLLQIGHEALDTGRVRLPHSNGNTIVIIDKLEGSLYIVEQINNSGHQIIGTLNGNMCKSFKLPKLIWGRSRDLTAQKRIKAGPHAITPPHSEGTGELDEKSMLSEPGVGITPPEYRYRPADWFTPGRLFNIWARDDVEVHDVEIHERWFVLLETRNIEGPGLRVRVFEEEEEKQANIRSHILVQNSDASDAHHDLDSQPHKKTVFMDECAEQRVQDRTYVQLEHQYNIPFLKYPCIDGGLLERSSLEHLRCCYLKWWAYHWKIDLSKTK